MGHDDYFICKEDTLGKLGFSSHQKCTAAIRMLAYGVVGDLVDEYMHISESTCFETMHKLCKAVVQMFGKKHLREPNDVYAIRLLDISASRGFLGMLVRINCMHWEWKNCPFALKGQYKVHECRVILEFMASQDLWI